MEQHDDWDDAPWSPSADTPEGEPSKHVKPGEQSWFEAELARRKRGEPPKWSLPGEPPLPHEPQPDPPRAPKRTGTGFFYANGDEIPPTHPDHGPMHLIPRQEDGSFAAYYYCTKDELASMGAVSPPPRRHRRDGFSAERQAEFIEHLRGCASITDAAHLTGIARQTVYNLLGRRDAAAFRAAVAEAFSGTDAILEATAFERAVHGYEEIVYHNGQRVGVRWKYDNRLLMQLLRARQPLKYAPLSELEGWMKHRGLEPPADVDGALDRLAIAEAHWGRQLEGEPILPAPLPSREREGPAALPREGEGQVPIEAPQIRPGTGRGTMRSMVEGPAEAKPEPEVAYASTSSISPADEAVCASTSSTSLLDEAVSASNLSTSNGDEAVARPTRPLCPPPSRRPKPRASTNRRQSRDSSPRG